MVPDMIPAPVRAEDTGEAPDVAIAGVGRGVSGGFDDGCIHFHGEAGSVHVRFGGCGQCILVPCQPSFQHDEGVLKRLLL